MSRTAVILLCLAALICAGCIGNNSEVSEPSDDRAVDSQPSDDRSADSQPLSAKIISPKIGTIFGRDKPISFDADVSGGKAPYIYSWGSNNQAEPLSQSKSFSASSSGLSYGEHIVILKVTDAAGEVAQATTNFNVI